MWIWFLSMWSRLNGASDATGGVAMVIHGRYYSPNAFGISLLIFALEGVSWEIQHMGLSSGLYMICL